MDKLNPFGKMVLTTLVLAGFVIIGMSLSETHATLGNMTPYEERVDTVTIEQKIEMLIKEFTNEADSADRRSDYGTGNDFYSGYADALRLTIHKLNQIIDTTKGTEQ